MRLVNIRQIDNHRRKIFVSVNNKSYRVHIEARGFSVKSSNKRED